jgi:hypothetical protein
LTIPVVKEKENKKAKTKERPCFVVTRCSPYVDSYLGMSFFSDVW